MSRSEGNEKAAKDDPVTLQASSASITTASVTIRTLRVNDRQLTQSIFKQLPKRELVDTTQVKLLAEEIWGWVNYDPDHSPADRQFVVQLGATLCRCPFFMRHVSVSNFGEWPGELQALGKQFAHFAENYLLACGLKRRLDFSHQREDRTYGLAERPFFGEFEVVFGNGKSFDEGMEHALRHQFHPETEWKVRRSDGDYEMESVPQERIDQLDRIYQDTVRQVFRNRTSDWERSPEYWSGEMDVIAAAADSYASRWNALMARLRTYEQLYIAA